jgi:serine/threonine protein kinase
LKKEALLYKGNNSAIYQLACKKSVCKVVYKYNMFAREKKFICFMKTIRNVYVKNIIKYYGVVPGNSIFIMEKADYDLLEWAKQNYKKPSYINHLKVLMGQMANGCRFLHHHRIEHYDFKPDNLLLVNGVLKISDFGTCHIDGDGYVLDTGTHGFMAPEIAGFTNKEYYVPHSMDVYSICLMLMYLYFAPVFKKFYFKNWTLEHYLSLQDYANTKYPFTFLKCGLVVDQRYRMTMLDLLNHIEKDAEKAIVSL